MRVREKKEREGGNIRDKTNGRRRVKKKEEKIERLENREREGGNGHEWKWRKEK